MTLTNRQLNNEAQNYADRLLNNLMNDKKEGTGFMGIGQKENDWDGIVAGLINFVWDQKANLEATAQNFADDAEDRQAELAARQIVTECQEMTEVLGVITDCIDDWNTEYKNNDWTDCIEDRIDENHDGVEKMDVQFRTAEKVAYEAAEWMTKSDYRKKGVAMEIMGRRINELWEVLKAADTIEEATNEAPQAAPNFDGFFK